MCGCRKPPCSAHVVARLHRRLALLYIYIQDSTTRSSTVPRVFQPVTGIDMSMKPPPAPPILRFRRLSLLRPFSLVRLRPPFSFICLCRRLGVEMTTGETRARSLCPSLARLCMHTFICFSPGRRVCPLQHPFYHTKANQRQSVAKAKAKAKFAKGKCKRKIKSNANAKPLTLPYQRSPRQPVAKRFCGGEKVQIRGAALFRSTKTTTPPNWSRAATTEARACDTRTLCTPLPSDLDIEKWWRTDKRTWEFRVCAG